MIMSAVDLSSWYTHFPAARYLRAISQLTAAAVIGARRVVTVAECRCNAVYIGATSAWYAACSNIRAYQRQRSAPLGHPHHSLESGVAGRAVWHSASAGVSLPSAAPVSRLLLLARPSGLHGRACCGPPGYQS